MSVDTAVLECPSCGERVPSEYVVCPYCGYSLVEVIEKKIKPRIGIRDSLGRVVGMFHYKHFRRTFNDIKYNPDRKGAFLMVYLVCVTFAGSLISKLFLSDAGGGILTIILMYLLGSLGVGLLLLPLAIPTWYVYSFIVWGIAKLLDGKGTYSETLGLLGYTLSPVVVNQFLADIILLIIGPRGSALLSYEASTMFAALNLPGFLAALYLAWLGLIEVHRLSKQYSAAVVGSFGLGIFLIFIFPLIF